MFEMFSYCENLSKLNLISFKFNNEINIKEMFSYCYNLNEVLINKLIFKKIKEQIDFSKLKI